ncbi:hypothetical protein [Nocardia ignorata]|uniref:Uncharacterized protein n=1 Tax=Nocardia ignorata TaxID=145285 RepID=A0A4R6PLR1_NOCIG|nr:hypothetical protein [Nocardia ignorata]TDP38756.1 hypothetical protein DFR75_103413 [Nocardia ignorata]
MSVIAAEQTMPATVTAERSKVVTLAKVIRMPRHLEQRPESAQHGRSAAELETLLAAAEQRCAELEDRNRELASDLDNALDQLAGHALHAEQERLVHPPKWSPWTASMGQEGHER